MMGGCYKGSIKQFPEKLAETAVECVEKVLDGETLEEDIGVEVGVYTADGIVYADEVTIKDDKYGKKENTGISEYQQIICWGESSFRCQFFSKRRRSTCSFRGKRSWQIHTDEESLSGAYMKDAGKVFLDGQEIQVKNTKESERLGISIIYQELNLIPELSVAENIFLDRQPKRNGFIDWKQMNQDAEKILEGIDMKIPPKMIVSTLSVAQRQMVEIAKAVSLGARLVIMDEPTSTLTEGETRKLFQVISSLKQRGITIIYISHRMDEIFEICDSYTILRDGTFISSGDIADVSLDKIIEDMVGRPLTQVFPERNNKIGDVILEAKNISNGKEVKDVSFTLRKGEILGFAGLVGAGRSETLKAVFGADKKAKGEIYMKGQRVNIRSPKDAIRYGIGFLPEERKKEGLVTDLAIVDNVTDGKARKCNASWTVLYERKPKKYAKSILKNS